MRSVQCACLPFLNTMAGTFFLVYSTSPFGKYLHTCSCCLHIDANKDCLLANLKGLLT